MNKNISTTTEPALDAFLLTRQWRDTEKGIILDLWLSSSRGPLHVVIDNQQAIFFIRQEDSQRVTDVLAAKVECKIKPLNLRDFENKQIAGVYFKSQRGLYQARECLQQFNIRHYEADIRPVERYLMERYLTGPVSIKMNINDNAIHHKDRNSFINPVITAQNNEKKQQPVLKVMSLDIETSYDTSELYSISLLCEHWHVTLMIGEAIENTQQIQFFSNERELIACFIDLVQQQDPDIFIGWNVINFDFQFLQKKADELTLPLAIGRGASLPLWRKAQTEQEHFFLMIPGRVVLDGIDTLKNAGRNFPSFSLENVSNELLGRGKCLQAVANNKDNKSNATLKKTPLKNDPLKNAKQIKRLFHEDKLALAVYNLEDCQLVWDIFQHTELIAFAIQRASLTGLEMDRMGGSVAAFDNLYLPRLHRKGYVAPNITDRTETVSAPGGYVMDSKPGLYDSVLVLDFKSLYPSIIRTFRVDPYARIKAEELEQSESIPGFNGVSFSRNDYILPDIIESLWHARDQAKQLNNKTLSQAIKIIMNSFYGVLGTPGCRVHDARLTSSITMRGHELMKATARLIEAEGYDVIYGDTDSVFVSLGLRAKSLNADKIGHYLVEKINHHWHKELKKKYQIESYLEMEFETHYQRFFMPTVRGSDKGSKKRYAGLICDRQQKQKKQETSIVFKGLESVRTDWTQLAREVQKEIYYRIFYDQAYEDYLKNVITDLKQGKLDDKLIYRKRLGQKLSRYKKNIPPHAQAALKARHYAQENKLSIQYEHGGWIEYLMTMTGPEPLEYNKQTLDYEHYIEKQIAPVVDSILMTVGSSLEKIIQVQYELF